MQPTTTTDPPSMNLIASGKRRGGLAAKLATELELVQRQLADAIERSGPEYLADADQELAAWLASVASEYPQIEEPSEPMSWPLAARVELGALITKLTGTDVPGGDVPRAEALRCAAQIHELVAAQGGAPDLADGIVLAWDRPYSGTRLVTRTVR